ncbi:MAG: putative Pre-mRNA-processing factor 17 [Streblomastix strix]|uniref:Putative Pre-mRNA-processing factor 17 n=1 Tax=Streblomastix strix TaxID=222440 RepID=A0A5J4X0A1_9EUKA|nr:MAG: putative Pre-mRNA-processing factor 17 [Streblomastix strix]
MNSMFGFDLAPDVDILPDDQDQLNKSQISGIEVQPGNIFTGKQIDLQINDQSFNAGDLRRNFVQPKPQKRKRINTSKKKLTDDPQNYEGPWANYEDENLQSSGLDPDRYKEVLDDRISRMNPDKLYRWQRQRELKEQEKEKEKEKIRKINKEKGIIVDEEVTGSVVNEKDNKQTSSASFLLGQDDEDQSEEDLDQYKKDRASGILDEQKTAAQEMQERSGISMRARQLPAFLQREMNDKEKEAHSNANKRAGLNELTSASYLTGDNEQDDDNLDDDDDQPRKRMRMTEDDTNQRIKNKKEIEEDAFGPLIPGQSEKKDEKEDQINEEEEDEDEDEEGKKKKRSNQGNNEPIPEGYIETVRPGSGTSKDKRAVVEKGTETTRSDPKLQERDFQGRTYLHPPTEWRGLTTDCRPPKGTSCIELVDTHRGACSAVRYFPKSGHLLLSCGMRDGIIKIWDVAKKRLKWLRMMDTGTSAPEITNEYGMAGRSNIRSGQGGVKDIQFNNDGSRFYSAGFDRWLRLWDTETGKCMSRYTTGKMINCVRTYPLDDRVVLCGMGDKKIVQWDCRQKHITQQYNEHLGPVLTVTFLRGSGQFASTSEDRSIRLWEFGIPVQTKLIAHESMYPIPFVAKHPSENFILAQSEDNQIITYQSGDRFIRGPKTFKGHISAGFCIETCASPDGKYIISGDSKGKLMFWEWDNPKKKPWWINAFDTVCCGAAWNPNHALQVASCSWNGKIKIWDAK